MVGDNMAKDSSEILSLIGQFLAYLLGIIIIIQILRSLFGGTWEIENLILAIVIFNLTITFSLGGYLLNSNRNLNSKIANIDKKIHGHIEWHKGKNSNKK